MEKVTQLFTMLSLLTLLVACGQESQQNTEEQFVAPAVEQTVEKPAEPVVETEPAEVSLKEIMEEKSVSLNDAEENVGAVLEGLLGGGTAKKTPTDNTPGSKPKCPILKVEQVNAVATTFSGTAIAQKGNSCSYEVEIDGEWVLINIMSYQMSESQIQKEIENYKTGPGGILSAQKSSAGNATLGIHKPNQFIMVLDPTKNYVIKVTFYARSYAQFNKDKTMADYDTAEKVALGVANQVVKHIL